MNPSPRGKIIARPRRVGLRSTGMSMTPEMFDSLPEGAFDDRYRYELIRGVLVVSPFAGVGELDPNDELGYLLRLFREQHPRGATLDATFPEHTIPATPNRRRCDRAIWAGLGRIPDLEKDLPTIVVEFVSDSRRDYEEKREEYLAVGVMEYWIIDRFRRIMTVYKRGPAGVVTSVTGEAESYRTDLLPGFDLPLARLLAQADKWPRKPRRRPRAGGTDG